MDGGGRQREEVTPGRENPGSDRYLIAQVEDIKGGAAGQGKVDTGSCEEILRLLRRGGKQRRAVEAGRRAAIQVDGRSVPWQDGGVEVVAKRMRH